MKIYLSQYWMIFMFKLPCKHVLVLCWIGVGDIGSFTMELISAVHLHQELPLLQLVSFSSELAFHPYSLLMPEVTEKDQQGIISSALGSRIIVRVSIEGGLTVLRFILLLTSRALIPDGGALETTLNGLVNTSSDSHQMLHLVTSLLLRVSDIIPMRD